MNRAYSLEELLYHESMVRDRYRLGSVVAKHSCGHKYRTKRGSRKESFVLEQGVLSPQTCSVCFKLRTTDGPDRPQGPQGLAPAEGSWRSETTSTDVQVVCQAEDEEDRNNTKHTPALIEAKSRFYNWLYQHLYN